MKSGYETKTLTIEELLNHLEHWQVLWYALSNPDDFDVDEYADDDEYENDYYSHLIVEFGCYFRIVEDKKYFKAIVNLSMCTKEEVIDLLNIVNKKGIEGWQTAFNDMHKDRLQDVEKTIWLEGKMQMYKFNRDNITGLNVKSHSEVIVRASKYVKSIEVEVTGSAKNIELVSVKEVDGIIYILDKSVGKECSFSITSNNSVMNFSGSSVSNISMSNGIISINGNNSGIIKVNGKTINLDDLKEENDEDKDEYIPTVITIYTSSVDLDLNLTHSGKFRSDVKFVSTYLETNHSSKVNITSVYLNISSSNSSFIEAEVLDGDLVISCSNSSKVITKGKYSSVRVMASNSSNVLTKGHCIGDYRASASNSAYVCNEAKIEGKKIENTSNSAVIIL